LRFSFIGFETQVIEVSLHGEAIVNATLSATTFMTEEVLVSAVRAGKYSPLAYSTVNKMMLKKQNTGTDLPYLLSLTPSLVETSEAGNGVGNTSLRIRGTSGSRINVTIDGIPLNDPESQEVFWVDIPDLASSAESIQVQRGAGTSSNGAGAFGATISIQTTNPEDEPFAEINSSVGSFNTIKKMISAGTGLLNGKFALQMRYSDLKSDGFVDRASSDHQSAFISGVFKTERSRLKANIIMGEEHTGISWWGVPGEILSTNRRYNPAGEYTDENGNICYYKDEADNYNQNHYQLIYSLMLNSDLTLNAALHYTRGNGYYEEYKEDASFSKYGLPDLKIGDTDISETDLIRRKWMSNDFYGTIYSLKYKKGKIDATVGGGLNCFSGDHYGKIIWMEYAGNTPKDHQWYLNKGTKWDLNIYSKVNYSLTEKLNLFGDLQYRFVSYDMSGADDDLKDIGQEHDFNFFNPKAGAFYSIDKNQDLYLSFSVANREPSRSDYKEAAGDASATPEPETMYNTEMGYKLRTTRSSFAINLYSMIYKDQLVPTGELSNVGYSIMTNVDKSYRIGAEITANLKPVDFFDWNLGFTLSRNKILDFREYYIDYNTIDWSEEYMSKNHESVDIAYSPSIIGTSDMKFNILSNASLHFISKYVGKQYFDNTMNPDRTIDPYFVNNIRLDFEPKIKAAESVELQFLVNNVFNSIYENNAYGGNWYEDGTEKSWSYYFPQAGINYTFKIGIKF
ncbi:MAG TPA: TonB-dependent receptor, partial [Bacteroidales bacterium]|nr:TonB-dependent receptor [Bacteroidales bacterium]